MGGKAPSSAGQGSDSTIEDFLREAAATSVVSRPGLFSGTERYELVRRLGEGGFGVVFEAIDHREGGRVALKVMRDTERERQYRFKREFRGLAELSHPNLVRLFELTATENHLFFTMELLDGAVSWLAWVRASRDRMHATLRQLASGLNALHAAGKLHRDVKPSNVLVDRNGRVVLADFGLAIEIATDQSSEVAGTPLYMSPEQCGEEQLTTACDWYSVGVMLYEALTGAPPFRGSLIQLVAAKRLRTPPPPSAVVPDVPADLDELCMALLQREPTRRPSGDEVLRRLSGAVPAATTARSELVVGRDAERAALLAGFHETRRGRSTISLLRGPSGIGKSTVLRSFLDEVRRAHADVVVLAGRCYERESVPYKALDPIIDELARYLRRLPEVDAASLVPRDATALAQLFPVLLQVPLLQRRRSTRAEGLTPSEVKSRGMTALRELLARLAEWRPVVMCVDDLHWGDVDSAALLAELARPPDPPALCFVGTFQEEEATTSPLLGRLAQLRATTLAEVIFHEVQLTPLGADDARRLASSLLAELHKDPARAQALVDESAGSPFLLHELARHEEQGRVEELVQRRVERLPEPARRLLQAISLIGYPVEPELAADAAGVRGELRDALDTLRLERLVRSRDVHDEKRVEVYHNRIRDPVVGAIADRRALHLRIAEAMERHQTDPVQIALHLGDAGDERARDYTLQAARLASEALAFDQAARLYETAIKLAPPDPPLLLVYAEALSTAGRGVEAAEIYLSLASPAEGRERIDLQRRAAEELLVAGHVERGYATLVSVFSSLGMRMPTSTLGALARIAMSRARIALRGLRFRKREAASLDLLRVDTLAAASLGVSMVDPIVGAAIQSEHLRVALRVGDPYRALAALCLEAGVQAVAGHRAQKHTQRILELARTLGAELPDTDAPAHLAVAEGSVALFQGRWLAADERLSEAEQLFRSSVVGHSSLRSYARVLRCLGLFSMGRVGEAARILPSLIRELDERGDFNRWAWMENFYVWVLGSIGRTAEAHATVERLRAVWAQRSSQLQTWWFDFGLEYGSLQLLLIEGDGDQAWRRVAAEWKTLRKAFYSELHRIAAHWARARAALMRASDPAHRAEMLADARGCVRALERERAAWGQALAKSLRACIASVEGDATTALKLLGEVEPELEASHMEGVLAAVCHARGLSIGGDIGRALTARAEQWMGANQVIPAANHAHLPGRWSR